MLLFADGFENIDPCTIWKKWNYTEIFDKKGRNSNVWGWTELVSGPDTRYNPPIEMGRKGGRGLRVIKGGGVLPFSLITTVKKSRTLYVGFAFRVCAPRSASDSRLHGEGSSFSVKFKSGAPQCRDLGTRRDSDEPFRGLADQASATVATLSCYIRTDRIDTTWSFPNSETQYGQIITHKNIRNGDWNYFQCAMTLYGNGNPEGDAAWVETRLGGRNDKTSRISGIQTARPGDRGSYSMDTVAIIGTDDMHDWTFDDVYICNDEGNFNNTFLGNVYVRKRLVSMDGSEIDGVVVNGEDQYRYKTVNDENFDIVDCHHEQDPDPPTPSENPSYLRYYDPQQTSFRLDHEGEQQTFQFHHTNFAGSEPIIHGAIMHAWVRTLKRTFPITVLKGVMYSGGIKYESNPMPAPLVQYSSADDYSYKAYVSVPFVWENDSIRSRNGLSDILWNTTATNTAEYGLELSRFDGDLSLISAGFERLSYTFDDLLEEDLDFQEFVSRHLEEALQDDIAVVEMTDYQRVFALYETLLTIDSYVHAAKGAQKYLNSVVTVSENIPWHILYLHERMDLCDKAMVTWLQHVDDSFDISPFAYGFWVEEFKDTLSLTSITTVPRIFIAKDGFYIGESDIFSGHFLIDEALLAESSYIFSGHEWLGETLYPAEGKVVAGWGKDIEDSFGVEGDHFDGNWVEQMPNQFSLGDTILTSQWRHDFCIGICVDSWEIKPIEQECSEGDRTGQITAQYWELMGYSSNPYE